MESLIQARRDGARQIRGIASRAGFGLAAMFAAAQVGGLFLALGLGRLPEGFYAIPLMRDLVEILALFLPMYGLGLPLFLLITRRTPPAPPGPRRKMSPGEALRWALLSIGAMYIFAMVAALLSALIAALQGRPPFDPLGAIPDLPLYRFASTVILAPICEELMFRDILLYRLVPLGEKTAVILSALAFGLFHGNILQFPYAVALGALFGAVALRYGSPRPAIALHMLVNFVGGYAVGIAKTQAQQAVLGLLLIALMAAAAVVFFKKRRGARWQENTLLFPAREKVLLGVFSWGYAVYFLLTAAAMAFFIVYAAG